MLERSIGMHLSHTIENWLFFWTLKIGIINIGFFLFGIHRCIWSSTKFTWMPSALMHYAWPDRHSYIDEYQTKRIQSLIKFILHLKAINSQGTDKVHEFIFIMPILSPKPIFDHFLESYQRDDSNKWLNIGFGEEIPAIRVDWS